MTYNWYYNDYMDYRQYDTLSTTSEKDDSGPAFATCYGVEIIYKM